MTEPDTVFAWGGGNLKFGPGAIDELGFDVAALGPRRVLVVTDRGVRAAGIVERVTSALDRAGLTATVYDDVEVEPTDESISQSIEAVRIEPFDAIVAVGGGSVIDTAKGLNLVRSCGGTLIDYVNAPVGGGRRPDRPLLPLVAVPTTAGSGSESSGVCVMDLLARRVKSGISDWQLRPTLAVVDPTTTFTLPDHATISSGLDVLGHALESLTAKPYDARPRPAPGARPTFSGANPFSDLLCRRSLELLSAHFSRAVHEGSDRAARHGVMLAATLTAVGSSTAGVHIPHACSYAIAAQAHAYTPSGDAVRRPFVPHGLAVAATVRATMEFTFTADPGRHVELADILRQTADGLDEVPDEQRLPARLTALFAGIGAEVELSCFGYDASHIPELVAGTLLQQRLLSGSPRDVDATRLGEILHRSLN